MAFEIAGVARLAWLAKSWAVAARKPLPDKLSATASVEIVGFGIAILFSRAAVVVAHQAENLDGPISVVASVRVEGLVQETVATPVVRSAVDPHPTSATCQITPASDPPLTDADRSTTSPPARTFVAAGEIVNEGGDGVSNRLHA